ncbi:MAG: DUF502 domain-containing protein [Cyclobacteriaceae bacterium]|nr:DUF502 domain-containing protein [Cyclobacteriaceae bacterium]
MKKLTLNYILTYFFRGLLFVVPLAITIYVLVISIAWIDGLLNITIPGIGLLIILTAITGLGYLASMFITKPFFEYFERAIKKVPFVSLIYTSLKDLIDAFVGDKKKFDKPVLVRMSESDNEGLYRIGFITQTDLSFMELTDIVAVYIPHSYNFSGNHYLVSVNRIKPLKIKGTKAMKFIVSGGVSGV